MMRRLVDTTIPFCTAIAITPTAIGLTKLPASVYQIFGADITRVWSVTVACAFTLCTVGVWLRNRVPATSLWMESSSLSFAGIVSLLYAIALWWAFGPQGWVAFWYCLAISTYSLARVAEMMVTLHRQSVNAQQFLDELDSEVAP